MTEAQTLNDPRTTFSKVIQTDLQGFTYIGEGTSKAEGSEGKRAGANFVGLQVQQYKSFKLVSRGGEGTFMVRKDYKGGSDSNLHYVTVNTINTGETFNIRSVEMKNLQGLFAAGRSSSNLNFSVYGRP